MSEVGEGVEQSIRREGPVLTDSQKELIGEALGVVDEVYGGAGRIRTANTRFGEETGFAFREVRKFPLNASPRENGYRQVNNLYETFGARIGSSLSRLRDAVDKLRLPDDIKYKIQKELTKVALLKMENEVQQHGYEANRLFEVLVRRVDSISEELSQLRRGCSRYSEENYQESSRIARRFPSKLTEGYARRSRRLEGIIREKGQLSKATEKRENEANITRRMRFGRIVEKLASSTPGKEPPATTQDQD